MIKTFRTTFLALITLISGLVVLLGYFYSNSLLANIRTILLQWAMTLAAVALLVGLVNLCQVHLRKLRGGQLEQAVTPRERTYSLVLILSLVITIILGTIYSPTGEPLLWIFSHVLIPIESSLIGVLAIILIYAAARLLYRRTNRYTVVFIITLLAILLGGISLPGIEIPGISNLSAWLIDVPALAGLRGILMGVALGILATGIRILLGSDRPYEG